MARLFLWVTGIIILLAVAFALLYRPVIRTWYLQWGATDEEARAVLPGDELVSGERVQSTRSINVRAPASDVWPWLVQMGQGRGGMYSYDWLENLVGCDIHTLNRIVPDLQTLKVGDTIKLGPQEGLPHYVVVLLERDQAMVLRSVDAKTGEMGETWGFFLRPGGGEGTRLVIRHNSPPSADQTARVVNSIFEPISFVMERKMLYGIRDRAEPR